MTSNQRIAIVFGVVAVVMAFPSMWESHQMNQCVSFRYKKGLEFREGKGIDPGVSQFAAVRECRS